MIESSNLDHPSTIFNSKSSFLHISYLLYPISILHLQSKTNVYLAQNVLKIAWFPTKCPQAPRRLQLFPGLTGTCVHAIFVLASFVLVISTCLLNLSWYSSQSRPNIKGRLMRISLPGENWHLSRHYLSCWQFPPDLNLISYAIFALEICFLISIGAF